MKYIKMSLGGLFVLGSILNPMKAEKGAFLDVELERQVDSAYLRQIVSYLSSNQMGGRLSGSYGDSLAAAWIESEFKIYGLEVAPFLVSKNASKEQRSMDQVHPYWQSYQMKASWGDSLQTRNVVGYVPGTDAVLKDRFIIIGAHFDHLGYGDKAKSSLRPDLKALHPGADDNASGVAGLLCLGRYFAKHPQARSLLFVSFSGEEIGLCGSGAFMDQWPFSPQKIEAMINIDMIGGLLNTDSVFTISGIGTAKEAGDCLVGIGQGSGLNIKYIPGGHGPSDHATFYARQIPVFFFATLPTPTYHTPFDTAGGLNYNGMARLIRLLGQSVKALACYPKTLSFVSTGSAQPTMAKGKFKVTLGLMPDINATEASNTQTGLKAMLVIEGKPAYKAGLRSGDLMLSLNGQKISTIQEYMEILSRLEKGKTVKLKALCKGKEKVLKIKL